MRSLLTFSALLGALSPLPCQAEPGKAEPGKAEPGKAAPKPPAQKPESMEPGVKVVPPRGADILDDTQVRVPPPKVQKTQPKGRNAAAAIRGGNKGPIKLVALAPTDDGVTLEDQPRLWWWQSESTEAGELEFVLSKLVANREQGQPETVLTVIFGPLKAGFNAIDLSQPLINKEQVHLEDGVEYQWSVGCPDGLRKDAFFVRMRRVGGVELANQWKAQPLAVPTLNSLSSSGNWYELFDAVAFPARLDPGNEACVKLRTRLIVSIGLDSALKP